MALNDKHRRFCDEYLIDLNATQAYLRAGYKVGLKVAAVNALRLLAKPEVQAYIARRQQELRRKTGITQERVIAEIEKVGFADAADYTDATLKVSNKLRALELLGKHLGIFEPKASEPPTDNSLLTALNKSTEEVWRDVPELQPEADAGDDLVEPPAD